MEKRRGGGGIGGVHSGAWDGPIVVVVVVVVVVIVITHTSDPMTLKHPRAHCHQPRNM